MSLKQNFPYAKKDNVLCAIIFTKKMFKTADTEFH